MGLSVDQLNDQQQEALDILRKRIEAEEPVSKLFGYAGTGKTSIAKLIAEMHPGIVQFGAFTGKAASVLTRKGCGARTIHSRIYLPAGDRRAQLEKLEKEYGELTPEDQLSDHGVWLEEAMDEIKSNLHKPGFILNPASDLGLADLFIIDEVSMVDEKMALDVLSFEVPVVVLGDPAQLPPVGSGGYFTRGGEKVADAMLTKVERQEEGGSIIDLATYVRENRCLPLENEQVVGAVSRKQAMSFDQILVGKNSTRWEKNIKMRRLLGRDGYLLLPGERIICLENHKNFQAMNGQQFRVKEVADNSKPGMTTVLLECECEGEQKGPCPDCGWIPKWVPMWTGGFMGIDEEARLKAMPYGKRAAALYATYGYAITVHKAQGSEWGSVLVYDESSVFRSDHWRWMYTAITRASERLTVVS